MCMCVCVCVWEGGVPVHGGLYVYVFVRVHVRVGTCRRGGVLCFVLLSFAPEVTSRFVADPLMSIGVI